MYGEEIGYSLIDDLSIGTSNRTGNRLKTVEDTVTTRLTYTGASDFVNGSGST